MPDDKSEPLLLPSSSKYEVLKLFWTFWWMRCIWKVSAWAGEFRAIVYSRIYSHSNSTRSSAWCGCVLGGRGIRTGFVWGRKRDVAGFCIELDGRTVCAIYSVFITWQLSRWCWWMMLKFKCVFSSVFHGVSVQFDLLLQSRHHYSADFLVTLKGKRPHSNAYYLV